MPARAHIILRYLILRLLIVSTFYSALALASEQTDFLARRTSWDARTQSTDTVGRKITELAVDTPLYDAGLRVNDVILAVNDRIITGVEVWNDVTDALVAERLTKIVYKRTNTSRQADVMFDGLGKENYANHDVEYGSIDNDYGFRQRTILTLPKTKAQEGANKLPAIFFIQGLSCSSIEVLPNNSSNYRHMIKLMVENLNMAMMRVEKPGVGDSEGSCAESDFATELAGYEHTLQKLMTDSRIDRNRIIVYGNSMGSAIAPYLVNKYQLNGVISDGTFFRSWFEHMLEIERRIQQMQGKSESEIGRAMNSVYIPLYYNMLINKQSYANIVTDNPLYQPFNYHGQRHMYGRPMAFYHQVQDFDFAGEWSKVTVPVRIRYGENDWIMSKSDNHMIIDVLTREGNHDVNLVIYPKLDHWSTLHNSPEQSFNGESGQWEDNIALMLVDWANELNAQVNR